MGGIDGGFVLGGGGGGTTTHTNNKCNNGYDRVHGSFKLLAVQFYLY